MTTKYIKPTELFEESLDFMICRLEQMKNDILKGDYEYWNDGDRDDIHDGTIDGVYDKIDSEIQYYMDGPMRDCINEELLGFPHEENTLELVLFIRNEEEETK